MVKYKIYPTLLDSFYWCEKLKSEQKTQELIDKINRVKTTMPLAAKKGVVFESIVNDVLDGITPEIHTKSFNESFYVKEDMTFYTDVVEKVVKQLGEPLKKQEFISGNVPTKYGLVNMYGFVDFTYLDKYVDLKTTGKYTIGKFINNHQHIAYPLIAKQNGINKPIFEYVVTDFDKCYSEIYDFDKNSEDFLIHRVESFIEWLESEPIKSRITDHKIFGIC